MVLTGDHKLLSWFNTYKGLFPSYRETFDELKQIKVINNYMMILTKLKSDSKATSFKYFGNGCVF